MEVTEFFTWETMGTVTGAAMVVWVIVTALRGVLQSYWTNRLSNIVTIVLGVALMVASAYNAAGTWQDYVLAVINGFVVYLAVAQFSTVTTNAVARARARRSE